MGLRQMTTFNWEVVLIQISAGPSTARYILCIASHSAVSQDSAVPKAKDLRRNPASPCGGADFAIRSDGRRMGVSHADDSGSEALRAQNAL